MNFSFGKDSKSVKYDLLKRTSLNEGTKRPGLYNKNKRAKIMMHQCARENKRPNLDGNELERYRERERREDNESCNLKIVTEEIVPVIGFKIRAFHLSNLPPRSCHTPPMHAQLVLKTTTMNSVSHMQ